MTTPSMYDAYNAVNCNGGLFIGWSRLAKDINKRRHTQWTANGLRKAFRRLQEKDKQAVKYANTNEA